jgi:hypothetical protein
MMPRSSAVRRADRTLQASVRRTVAFPDRRTAPLLAQNEAISRFVRQHCDSELRFLLPEVTSVHEALRMADQHRPMNPIERMQVASMLSALK